VLDPQLLVDALHLILVADLERERLGRAENGISGNDDLDLARWHLRVLGLSRALAHLSGDAQTRLALDLGDVREGSRVEQQLHDSGAVTQIDEKEAAKVADPVRPTVQGDLLAGVPAARLAAIVRALYEAHGDAQDTWQEPTGSLS
jgi:hypothetical protein